MRLNCPFRVYLRALFWMACVDSLPLFPCSCLLSWNKSFRKVFRRLSLSCSRFSGQIRDVRTFLTQQLPGAAFGRLFPGRCSPIAVEIQEGMQATPWVFESPWPGLPWPKEVSSFPAATINMVQELCLCFSKQSGLLNCLLERNRLDCTCARLFLAEHDRPSCQPSPWAS